MVCRDSDHFSPTNASAPTSAKTEPSTHSGVELLNVPGRFGLLLQPVPASGASRLEKGLRLPLPADPLLHA